MLDFIIELVLGVCEIVFDWWLMKTDWGSGRKKRKKEEVGKGV